MRKYNGGNLFFFYHCFLIVHCGTSRIMNQPPENVTYDLRDCGKFEFQVAIGIS